METDEFVSGNVEVGQDDGSMPCFAAAYREKCYVGQTFFCEEGHTAQQLGVRD